MSQPLPNDIEAERAVLCSLLLDNEHINNIVEIMTIDDFYLTSHQKIYQAMFDLYEEEQKFDILSIVTKLKQTKELDIVGGAGYISSLLEVVPTPNNIEIYAKAVNKKSLLRKLITLTSKITAECFDDSETIEKILDKTEQQLFDITERRDKSSILHISKIVQENLENLDNLYHNKKDSLGVLTGFYELDNLTNGFQKKDLIYLAARPSVGKTSFILNCVDHITSKEKSTFVVSLEMSRDSLFNRIMSSKTGISTQRMRSGKISDDEWKKINDAANIIFKRPLYIDDTPSMNIVELKSKLRRMKRQHDIEIAFIDYLQLIAALEKGSSKQQEITNISAALKSSARELDIPIIVCCQLSREIEKRKDKEPKLSDLRDSGSIEQDGDLICFLHKKDDISMQKTEIIQFNLGKQRNGPVGNFNLLFMRELTSFKNMTENPEPEQEEPENQAEQLEEWNNQF